MKKRIIMCFGIISSIKVTISVIDILQESAGREWTGWCEDSFLKVCRYSVI